MSRLVSRPKPNRLILWAIPLFLAGFACNAQLPEFGFGQKTATGTHPAAYLLTPANRITPKITPTATQPVSGAACLPGVWQADHDSVIEYMSDTMLGVGESGYTPSSSEGKLEVEIKAREVSFTVENYLLNVDVSIEEDPEVTYNEVAIQANATANYLASDSQINFTDISYSIEGSLEFDGGFYNMEIEDLINIANIYGFARDVTLPVQTLYFSYSCSGDILTIKVNPFAEMVFTRTQ
ncbi:MAG: hypothetical protein PVF83_09145 [Anaerolineales bacterium]|jgi:hypothetical protein